MEKERLTDSLPVEEALGQEVSKKRRTRKGRERSPKPSSPEKTISPPETDWEDILGLPKKEKAEVKKPEPKVDESEIETSNQVEDIESGGTESIELVASTSEEIFNVPLETNNEQVIIISREERLMTFPPDEEEGLRLDQPLSETAAYESRPVEVAEDGGSDTPPPPPEKPGPGEAGEPPEEPPPLPPLGPDYFRPHGPAIDPSLPPITEKTIPPHSHEQHSDSVFWFLLGNLWQRRKRKQLERRVNKAINKQTKRSNKLQKEQTATADEVDRLSAEQTALKRHKHTVRPEQLRAVKQPELKPVQLSVQEVVLPPEAQAIAVELDNQLPEHHRLEHSAWHTIEVDDKTGHAVERPVFEYGQEFKREIRQEAWRPDDEVAVASGQLAVGDVTSVSAGGSGGLSTPIMASVVNRLDKLESTFRDSGSNNTNNLVLAGLLILILITIFIVSFL